MSPELDGRADSCLTRMRAPSPASMHGTRSWEAWMVARVRAGDDAALATIYDQFAALVHGVATRLVGPHAAVDITQDVFVGLWRRPEGFDAQRGSLRTYLVTVARRRAIDVLRQRSRQSGAEARASQLAHPPPTGLDETAIATIEAERVRRAFGSLPDEQRTALELAYFRGLTHREIAAATASPIGTVKSRLRLALGRVAAALDAPEPRGSTAP